MWVGKVGQQQIWVPQGLRGHVLFFCVCRIIYFLVKNRGSDAVLGINDI